MDILFVWFSSKGTSSKSLRGECEKNQVNFLFYILLQLKILSLLCGFTHLTFLPYFCLKTGKALVCLIGSSYKRPTLGSCCVSITVQW